MMSLLEQEIQSQAEVIARVLDYETAHVARITTDLPPFTYILIAARGTSDHAALYAKYAWGALAGYPVALAAPSLHTLYQRPPRLDGALVVGISQSGQSPDIVAVVEEGKRQGRPTLAITNDSASPLAGAADHTIELHAGQERSIAATKTYTAELAVIAALAATWSGDAQRLAELRLLPGAVAATLQSIQAHTPSLERYQTLERCVVIGRGYNYATANELALKLKELTYVMALPYSSADFRHGPIAVVDAGDPIILVAPAGATAGDMLELATTLRERGAELLVISEQPAALALAATPLPFAPSLPEWLSPVTAIIPGQMLALRLALAKGLDPNQPRGLHKVTRTM